MKSVAVAVLEQRVEHPRADERRVHVAVPGRRPLEPRVCPATRPACRSSATIFGSLDCTKSAGTSDASPSMPRQRRERVVLRREGVHEHERQPHAEAPARVEHLARDDVEERQPVLDLQQRLRLRHPHARAEPAVELEHDGLRRAPRARRRRAPGARRRRAGSPTGSISDSGSSPVSPSASALVESRNVSIAASDDLVRAHLVDARLQPVTGASLPSVGLPSSQVLLLVGDAARRSPTPATRASAARPPVDRAGTACTPGPSAPPRGTRCSTTSAWTANHMSMTAAG